MSSNTSIEFDNAKEKFKLLYEIAYAEYKEELDRIKSIEDKAGKIFTLLNLSVTLLVTFLTNKLVANFYNNLVILSQGILTGLVILMFITVILAWFELFKNLTNKKYKRLDLKANNTFEDIAYDDSKDINYFYWQAYKNLQKAVDENSKFADSSFTSLSSALDFLKYASIIFCVILVFLYIAFLNSGAKLP